MSLIYQSKFLDDDRKTAADALVVNPPAGAIEALERFLARSLESEFSAESARSSASSNWAWSWRYLPKLVAAISSASSTWRL